MNTRHYKLSGNVSKKSIIALVADLHDQPFDEVLKSMQIEMPDYIIINGDLLYAAVPGYSIYTYISDSRQNLRNTINAQSFLKEVVKMAPVLFSLGNHELYLDEDDKKLLQKIGVILIDNAYVVLEDIVFGGLSSPYKYLANTGKGTTRKEHKRRWELLFEKVDISWLEEFESRKGYKVLLSHHPEFYELFLKNQNNIDLILSGHAHGGQIRIFGRGVFAYGQGWFPKYTSGMYDNKMIVSRGLANTSRIPRLFNPKEMVYITVEPM